jgi:hypothetical protein
MKEEEEDLPEPVVVNEIIAEAYQDIAELPPIEDPLAELEPVFEEAPIAKASVKKSTKKESVKKQAKSRSPAKEAKPKSARKPAAEKHSRAKSPVKEEVKEPVFEDVAPMEVDEEEPQ